MGDNCAIIIATVVAVATVVGPVPRHLAAGFAVAAVLVELTRLALETTSWKRRKGRKP